MKQFAYWPTQYRYIRHQLIAAGQSSLTDRQSSSELRRFADSYLRRDGLFVLRLVALNAGELASSELLVGLWEAYGLSDRETFKIHKTSAILTRPGRKAPNVPHSATSTNVVNNNIIEEV